jgi:uncharacterized protein with NAD-binding domain and iron-sulfur cluster
MAARQRLAILGGGLGSLATAFHLTESPDWREKFDITVYQQGWRLGGKCASGRDMRPGYGSRIYEHGLHLFGGFYDYSFDLLRRCYEALERPEGHPNRRYLDAFIGLDAITLMDRIVGPDGGVRFEPWRINFEGIDVKPGLSVDTPPVTKMIAGMVRFLGYFDPELSSAQLDSPTASSNFLQNALDAVKRLADRAVVEIAEDVVRDALGNLEAYSVQLSARDFSPQQRDGLGRLKMAIFLVQAVVHGMIADNVLTQGFNHLDVYELKDWIRRHGEAVAREYKREMPDPVAAAAALAECPIVRGSYDYVFGYADGDINQPAQGAGTALRGFLRLAFGFKGHIFYAMRGGMGDVVIAPLYQALARRGVKFEFFSRVDRLVPGGTNIDAVEIAVQARLAGERYEPLIDLKLPGWPESATLPSWPGEPLWDQLQDGARLKAAQIEFEAPWGPSVATRTLRRGVDFDQLALGIPIGELRRICADLKPLRPAWTRMLDQLATTRTLALQLWMRRTNEDLGCDDPGRTLTGNAQPFSCWADMTHLTARENWLQPDRPLSIHYFCGQMRGDVATSAAEQDQATAQVEQAARSWLLAQAPLQWPAALSPGSDFGLDPDVLVDPENRAGNARFEGQYWRANVSPSELYVQYVPGSFPSRLRADESGFGNLFLCGDWTRNGLNAGAAESAVMSGVICANVILGDPSPIAGEQDVW